MDVGEKGQWSSRDREALTPRLRRLLLLAGAEWLASMRRRCEWWWAMGDGRSTESTGSSTRERSSDGNLTAFDVGEWRRRLCCCSRLRHRRVHEGREEDTAQGQGNDGVRQRTTTRTSPSALPYTCGLHRCIACSAHHQWLCCAVTVVGWCAARAVAPSSVSVCLSSLVSLPLCLSSPPVCTDEGAHPGWRLRHSPTPVDLLCAQAARPLR